MPGLITYKIAGIDRSSAVEKRSVSIKTALGRRSDTANFTIIDDDGSINPQAGQEVIIEQDGARIFGGILGRPERDPLNPVVDAFKIQAQDFGKLLDKRLTVQSFLGPQPAGDIIKFILDNFVKDPSIDQTNIQDGPDIDFIGFNYKTARQAIEEIARLTSFTWYIDADKKLHYISKSTNAAPFQIQSTEERYRALKIKPDTSQLANRIIVRGGTTESDLFEETHKGNSNDNTINLAYFPVATPVVTRGGVKTVGIKNVDDPGIFDFLYDANNKALEYDVLSPNSSNVVIEYRFRIPVLVQVEDAASISEVSAIETSDGIYEKIIVDDSIETLDAARDRAQAEIDRYGRALHTGSFKTWFKGFRAGQQLQIDFPSKGINLQLIVTSVTFRSDGNGQGIYNVNFGSFNYSFEDFLLDLFENGRKISVREGEVLDVLDLVNEQIPVGDSLTLCEFIAPPFFWGPGSAQDALWGQGEWS